ncbi:MAG: 4Fe-4S binding protein [Chitinispirillia bacterium]|jgi:ferredoxin
MIKIDRRLCDDCGTCVSVCAENALRIVYILKKNDNLCTECGKCIQVCPFGAIITVDPGTPDESN